MLKQFLNKSFSMLMVVLVLLSTVSFSVEKHFCGENLIDVAVFTEAKKCGDNIEKALKKSCCKDEVEIIKGQDELKIISSDDIRFNKFLFIATFTHTYINLFESLPKKVIPFKDYSPPSLVVNIQVLNQIFLI